MFFFPVSCTHPQVVASWDLLELPVVDADQWEANRAKAREADSAFEAELLRRAQEWQESPEVTAEESGISVAPTTPPQQVYEHEHSKDFLGGAEDATAAAAAAAPGESQPVDEGEATGAGGLMIAEGGEARETNGSVAAANTGLVGIMFDSLV